MKVIYRNNKGKKITGELRSSSNRIATFSPYSPQDAKEAMRIEAATISIYGEPDDDGYIIVKGYKVISSDQFVIETALFYPVK